MKTLSGLAAILFAGVFAVGCSTTSTTSSATKAPTAPTTVRSVPSTVVQPSTANEPSTPATKKQVEKKEVEEDAPKHKGCGGGY